MEYKRWLSPQVELALLNRRVVILVGARQCGKTTLTRALIKTLLPGQSDYRTLDDLTLLEAARSDPHAFVKRNNELMIIDEIQRVPELLIAIKKAVDEDSTKGQYLLTGSADIRQLPTVKESLAGRVAKLNLRPLAQAEIHGKDMSFLTQSFARAWSPPQEYYDRDAVIEMALQGGFPEPLTLRGKARGQWHRDYLDALIDRDLKEIVNIRRRDHMLQLLNVLGAWSSQYIDLNAIQSALSIQRPTLESHLNALETLFLVERLPAFAKTEYARIGKRAKLYMNDSGMMASILKWQHDTVRLDDGKLGKLVETLVYNEIAANVSSQTDYQLYHYRDREQREIDLLVERDDGALLGIEVKSGSMIKRDHFKHLEWFRDNLLKVGQNFTGIILYTGEKVIPFAEDLWAVPMGCLL